MYNPLGLQQ